MAFNMENIWQDWDKIGDKVEQKLVNQVSRVLASRVYGCLFGTLVHEKYLFWGEKTPYLLDRIF